MIPTPLTAPPQQSAKYILLNILFLHYLLSINISASSAASESPDV